MPTAALIFMLKLQTINQNHPSGVATFKIRCFNQREVKLSTA